LVFRGGSRVRPAVGITHPLAMASQLLSTMPTSPSAVRSPPRAVHIYPDPYFGWWNANGAPASSSNPGSPERPRQQLGPGGADSKRPGGKRQQQRQEKPNKYGQAAAWAHDSSPLNRMKDVAVMRQEPPWTDVTTVMMRNLPNKYCQQMLLEELAQNGFHFQTDFDFFYLPMDHANNVNLGYCFINFVDTSVANRFAVAFSGKRMQRFKSAKTISIMPASVQGYERNYQYYSATRVAQAEDPQHRPIFCRPMVLQQHVEADMYMGFCAEPWWGMPQQLFEDFPQGAYRIQPTPQNNTEQVYETEKDDGTFVVPPPPMPVFPELVMVPPTNEADAGPEQRETGLHGMDRVGVRNTFLHIPFERSPSVERQVRSCPVSAPRSEAGSARIDAAAFAKPRHVKATKGQGGPARWDRHIVEAARCLEREAVCDGSVTNSTGSADDSTRSCPVLQPGLGENCAMATLTSGTGTPDSGVNPQTGAGSSCVEPADSEGPARTEVDQAARAVEEEHLPSAGSALHRWGACKPCAFHGIDGKQCTNGIECAFCHLCEPGEKKRRKQARQALRRERMKT